LAAKLVKAGLCRIHTIGTMMPDGQREFDFEARLRALEKEAKAAQRGAWGKSKRALAKPKT
jgi:endonuclease YncB( thermonuclease family)